MKHSKCIYQGEFVIPSKLGYDVVDFVEASQTVVEWEEEGILNRDERSLLQKISPTRDDKNKRLTFWRMERIKPWEEAFRHPIGELELVCVELLSSRGSLFKDGWGDQHYKQLIDDARDVMRKKGFNGSNHYLALSEPRFTGDARGSSLALVQFYVKK